MVSTVGMNLVFLGYISVFGLSVIACLGSIPRAQNIQHPGTRECLTAFLPLMYEPLGAALFAVGTLLVYFQRFDAVRLTGGTDDPAIFLDPDNRIRDYTRAAQSVFPERRESIGNSVESVSDELTKLLADEDVITVTRNGETRFYEVSNSPFMAGELQTGQLVTGTDVTDRDHIGSNSKGRPNSLKP
jgi:hypothetical protein